MDDANTGLDYEYLVGDKANFEFVAYYKYMVRVAATLGANPWFAGLELAESLLFEVKLAEVLFSIFIITDMNTRFEINIQYYMNLYNHPDFFIAWTACKQNSALQSYDDR